MTSQLLFALLISTLAFFGLFLSYRFWGPKPGIPILMYHKLDKDRSDILTVKVSDFAKQLHYLIQEECTFLTFKELLDAKEKFHLLPQKSILLTFDDGYQNNYDHLLPLLKQHGIKATIFLPVDMIGKENEWDGGGEKIMDWETLKEAKEYFEYGLHSYQHRNMAEMTKEEFRQDLENCLETLDKHQLEVVPVLAYPYGKFPKNAAKFKKFAEVLDEFGIQYALRIGNKTNAWPIQTPYKVCRFDIRGTDTLPKFKSKITRAYAKLF